MTQKKPIDWKTWLLLLLCTAGLFWFSYRLFALLCYRPSSDLSIHMTWAGECSFSDWRSFFHHAAHPMWHMLVTLAKGLFGFSLEQTAAAVTALCKAAEFVLIALLFFREETLRGWRAVLAALCCVLVSSLRLSFYNPTVYLGVGTPNTWHSPTQMISMVWMLLCVPYVARCYDDGMALTGTEHSRLNWKRQALLCLLLLGSLAAKPTFMQTFLPAACLFYLVQWIRRPKATPFVVQTLLWVLPAVALMVLQFLYYFGIIVPYQSGMVLEMSWAKLGSVLLATLLIQAFPLYALWVCRRQKKDTLFWLTLWMDVTGVVEFLILGESGRRAADGNFGWGLMGAALMLWVVMLPRFLRDIRERGKPSPAHWAGLGLLLWHLGSGIYYLYYLVTSGNAL